MVTDDQQWYVQKGAKVQGPYSTTEVGRYLLLGRVRNTDRVSRDGELWEPVTQVPELIPEELLDLDNEYGWQRFLHARQRQDERQYFNDGEKERRNESSGTEQIRRDWIDQPAPQGLLPWSLLGITLTALGVVLYLNSVGVSSDESVVTSLSAVNEQRLDIQLRQLEFHALLHRKLDLQQLLESFVAEGQAFVRFDGLQYQAGDRGMDILLGDMRQHRQCFELSLGDKDLGEVTLLRLGLSA